MRRWGEMSVFVGLAVLLHLVAFGLRPAAQEGASQGGGGGGDTAMIVAGASDTISDLVTQWQSPPATPVAGPALAPPPEATALPEVPVAATGAPSDAPPLPRLPEPPHEAAPDRPTAPAQLVAPPQPTEPAPPDTATEAAPEAVPRPPERPDAPPQEQAPRAARTAPAGPSGATQAAGTRAGTAGGGSAGGTGGPAGSALSAGQRQSLAAGWGATIRARIERYKRYPSAARRAEGTTTVALTVARDGRLSTVSVARSSGNAALDQAAIAAVRQAGRFPAAPKGLTDASYRFSLPIRFDP
ncbi:TonB family protein [Tropicimonas sp. IMCC34043]|uniref:TonB family protein n=1 Tax=Tropicimonas sp. IMCC34043 TaxID=2248760 RepID=UPI0013006753|nr:TonB family protein [Tropicimonas sp. IMCC34043]